jgi:catechol 2,3-dioxygenase-like lactoylglutathione lyase family enzyme
MQPRVTLGVEDFARALAFYRDGLGLPVASLMDDVVFFKRNGVRLARYGRAALATPSRFRTPLTG